MSDKDQVLRQMDNIVLGSGEAFATGFEKLFSYLDDKDPDIRAKAASILGDDRKAISKLMEIYQVNLNTDTRKAILGGRVVGRKLSENDKRIVRAQIAAMYIGINLPFIACICVECGNLNYGIPCPNGNAYDFGAESSPEGFSLALPVLCDHCGEEYYVTWR